MVYVFFSFFFCERFKRILFPVFGRRIVSVIPAFVVAARFLPRRGVFRRDDEPLAAQIVSTVRSKNDFTLGDYLPRKFRLFSHRRKPLPMRVRYSDFFFLLFSSWTRTRAISDRIYRLRQYIRVTYVLPTFIKNIFWGPLVEEHRGGNSITRAFPGIPAPIPGVNSQFT